MKIFLISLVTIFLTFLIINIIFEYIHIFNLKKHKNKKNTNNKRLLKFFLHIQILKEIIVNSFINFFIKIKVIFHCIYRYVSFNRNKYISIPMSEKDESLINKDNCEIKTIYFIRHSESVWNNTFNKKLTFKTFMNISLVIFYEFIFLFSKKSALIDAPLSTNGIIQSLELSNFLQKEKKNKDGSKQCVVPINQIDISEENAKKYENSSEMIKLQRCDNKKNKTFNNNKVAESNVDMKNVNLKNNNDEYDHEEIINLSIKEHIDVLNKLKYNSVLLCSDLRRTISSCFISFYNRINKFNESIYVLNSLQEISRNPDCVPLLRFFNKYITTDIEKFLHKDVERLFKRNLKIANTYSKSYFLDTLKYIFNNENNIFIIFGHSLWFLLFFNYFLKIPHKAKTYKMQNSSIVVFNIMKCTHENKVNYEIEKNSIRVIYKGFDEK
ncbi:conserved Plasmodium protein, unknown function [Plasmodium gallinaceum]|uniref:Phosphoglycerate mutase n=1 Tax=Plasmodium gallinaceum TaxID=5849 RepID=A0A1J1GT44_PLAGA|nr:conserved Plasmodium protein, unknown function [Plasmodium gallinaceum]CRG95615.1 conserved Plasmodium protein, unknown function [Plasmodium gallinaceum]